MPPRKPSVVVSAPPRSDGQLSILEVDWGTKEILFSTGELTFSPYEKCLSLCEWLCQQQSPLRGIRTWHARDGNELIELSAADGETTTEPPTAVTWKMTNSEGVF